MRLDLFAKQIKLNYKGKESFKTLFGGLLSLMIFITILLYAAFLVNQMIQRKGASRTLSTEIKDLQENPQIHQPGLGTFKFAVSYTDTSDDPYYDETYFRIYMGEVDITKIDENRTTLSGYRDLEPELWGQELFDQNSVWFRDENTAIFWPKYNDYEIQGIYASDNFKYLNISIVKCSPFLGHENCKSSDEIDAKLAGGRFVIIAQNSYVDFGDYENVIKTYIDERFLIRVSPGIQKESVLYMRNNHVTLYDSIIQIGQGEERQFYSIENSESDFSSSESFTYVSFLLRMEAREDTYERTVFSFFDLTGLVGGVFEILEVVGSILVTFFTHKLFMFSMLNDLYQVQKIDSNHEFSKVIPKTKELRTIKRSAKTAWKMYEENKIPNTDDKGLDYSSNGLNSSNINEIIEMQNN